MDQPLSANQKRRQRAKEKKQAAAAATTTPAPAATAPAGGRAGRNTTKPTTAASAAPAAEVKGPQRRDREPREPREPKPAQAQETSAGEGKSRRNRRRGGGRDTTEAAPATAAAHPREHAPPKHAKGHEAASPAPQPNNQRGGAKKGQQQDQPNQQKKEQQRQQQTAPPPRQQQNTRNNNTNAAAAPPAQSGRKGKGGAAPAAVAAAPAPAPRNAKAQSAPAFGETRPYPTRGANANASANTSARAQPPRRDEGFSSRAAAGAVNDGAAGAFADRPAGGYHRTDRAEAELFKDRTTAINFDNYDKIQASVKPNDIKPVGSFAAMALDPLLQANVERCGYSKPTPVQRFGIPVVLEGKDLMACAQTGSGKTAAFLLPALHVTLQAMGQRSRQPQRVAAPLSLVVAPTRELAIQIYDEGRKFTYGTGLRCVVVYGGASQGHQLSELRSGCDICVATPGRLWDFFKSGNIISFRSVRFLVLDEADRMLDMGFEPQIRQIVESRQSDMPPVGARQTLMYSATFPQDIQTLARHFLARQHYFVQVGRVGSTTERIKQQLESVGDGKDRRAQVLRTVQSHPDLSVLVFVDKKRTASRMEKFLREANVTARSIHGDHAQKKREESLQFFRDGRARVLVATDVAGRGLDLPDVGLVLQADLPKKIDDYVHRIGRTGRAGKSGLAIAYVANADYEIADDLALLFKEAKQPIPQCLAPLMRENRAAFRPVLDGLKAQAQAKQANKAKMAEAARAAKQAKAARRQQGQGQASKQQQPPAGQHSAGRGGGASGGGRGGGRGGRGGGASRGGGRAERGGYRS